MGIRNQILEPDTYYHIFNRGNNRQKIFLNNDNYIYFLRTMKRFLLPVLDVCVYCLMPNHFHLIIKIKSANELGIFFQKNKNTQGNLKGLHASNKIVSKQFAKLFSAYTQAFNKQHSREGSLLDSPFKRIKIDSEAYLLNSIVYIHQNPIDLGVDFRSYKYSSYPTIVTSLKTSLKRNEVIALFDDVENFKYVHNRTSDFDDTIL